MFDLTESLEFTDLLERRLSFQLLIYLQSTAKFIGNNFWQKYLVKII